MTTTKVLLYQQIQRDLLLMRKGFLYILVQTRVKRCIVCLDWFCVHVFLPCGCIDKRDGGLKIS